MVVLKKKYKLADLAKVCGWDRKIMDAIAESREKIDTANDAMSLLIDGVHKCAIAQGSPGMGKTTLVTKALEEAGKDFLLLSSHATPGYLYMALYEMRKSNQFVVLDDCDGILRDESGLNLLKAATDTKPIKTVGWGTSREFINPVTKEPYPNSFEYEGNVIICTNVRGAKSGRVKDHLMAIASRVTPIDLEHNNIISQYGLIAHMIYDHDYLNNDPDTELSEDQQIELLHYLNTHLQLASRLDLRLPSKIARVMRVRPDKWQSLANTYMAAM
jgi:hypothetical protein